MKRELTRVQKRCLAVIQRHRGRENPISYQDLAVIVGEHPRRVRAAVQKLIRRHRQPICSSYDPRSPGYYWPQTREEIEDTCTRLIRHGVRILQRARSISDASAEEVLGQVRMALSRADEGKRGEAKTT